LLIFGLLMAFAARKAKSRNRTGQPQRPPPSK
jgi:hypothetical protein